MKRKMQNGIDVYTGQGVIDWRKVADSGISFAMIKASQGRGETRATKNLRSFTDSRFAYNIAEASKAGLMVGVWHWLTAQSVAEAIEEADYFLKVIAPHRSKITLWAAADVESETYLADIGKPELTQITRAFLN
ncbi:MAG: GH25 family lysozyme, partial [Eubacteriales bacterium]